MPDDAEMTRLLQQNLAEIGKSVAIIFLQEIKRRAPGSTLGTARRAVDEANANVTQQKTQVLLAQQQFDRAAILVQKGFRRS